MKRDKLWMVLCGALALMLGLMPAGQGGIMRLLALPFSLTGRILRAMSLSGGLGNAAALLLYGAVSAVPLVFWLRGRRRTEDWLLVLLSGVTALVLYYMINPNLRHAHWQNEMGEIVYAGAFWSCLATWGVLKLVGYGERIVEGNIYRALRVFLLVCAGCCLISAFGTNVSNLLAQLRYYGQMDDIFGTSKTPTYIFLVLSYAASGAELGLTAMVLYRGAKLLAELERDPFGEGCVRAAGAVSGMCRGTLMIVSLMSLSLNLGQVLLAGILLNVNLEVRIPVFGMAVAFGVMALSRLLTQGKALKDETDLFI